LRGDWPDKVFCGNSAEYRSLTRVVHQWNTSYGLSSTLHLGEEGNEMHPEDLMKPDLLSEIILLGGGELVFVSLLLIVLTVLTRA
jgi:hypothetical protein